MGRRKRNRGRKRSEAAKLAANFYEQGLEREVEDSLQYHGCKQSHSAYAKEVAKREQELLSRTVYVSNVKNLRDRHNLALLEDFFRNRYGPVELCILVIVSGKKGTFPKARVRFRYSHDAQRIFGGKELSLVQRDRDRPVDIRHDIGHKGFLRIQPSKWYNNMDEPSIENNKVIIPGDQLQIGHWCAAETDEYVYAGYEERGEDNLFLIEDAIHHPVEFSVDVTSRTVEVRLQPADHMISFRFKDLQGAVGIFHSGSSYAIAFRLKYPPRIYRLTTQGPDRDGVLVEIATRCLEMGGVRNEIFGSCYGYMVQISRYNVEKLFESETKLRKMKQFGLLSRDLYSLRDARTIATRYVDGDRDLVVLLLHSITDRLVGLMLRSLMDNGRFCWYHALHDLASTPDGEMNIFELVESTRASQALNLLEKMASMTWPTRYPAKSFQAIMMLDAEKNDDEEEVPFDMPTFCTRTPRLLVTPTRIAVAGFSVEMSNRVVRHFLEREGFEPESFLRVTIGEESGSRLLSNQLSPEVCARIKSVVLQGLTLNGREYRFLAYSSSQLKESSLWMVDASGEWNVTSIRKWMGDFSMCESPSKVAARMGQCFSTTVVASETKNHNLRMDIQDDFADVVSNWNGKEMCHSDGTGIIERTLLLSVIDRLPLGPSDPTEVSMVQVRFGGAKGTLTAWDLHELRTLTPLPRYRNVLLRPSMVKFKAPYHQLEVISIGKQVPYYLNRNVILLLGVHGIRDEVFLGMQRRMLDNLDAMLTDHATAMQMIPRLSGPDSSLSSSLIHMLSCGLSPRDEPFLFSCIHAIRAHHLMTLRKKSRVFVEKGAVLLGGLDETGLVPEGCVFLQIRMDGVDPERNANINDSGFKILSGPVMVTKHPVMHPGDVRMLLAVVIPELREHKNCILFSRHGDRPEADKMAGSDLDGDQFAVTWDERLFLGEWNGCVRQPSGIWRSAQGTTLVMQSSTMAEDAHILQMTNREPMDFDPDTITSAHYVILLSTSNTDLLSARMRSVLDTLNDGVDDEKLISHFIKHARNDNLGQIAMMWIDYAARKGADCEECLQLAGLHSIAVDFPKSGKPATIPLNLFIPRYISRAHWREKKDCPSYDCTGPIGQMYDQIVSRMGEDKLASEMLAVPLAGRRFDRHGQVLRFLASDQANDRLPEIYKLRVAVRLGLDLEATADPDSQDTPPLDLIGEAKYHRDEYEQGLIRLMSKYGLQCEGELLTGCIRKFHKLDKKRQHHLSETVRAQCRELRKNHRRLFFLFVLYTVCPSLDTSDVDNETENCWVDHVEAVVTGKTTKLKENNFSRQDNDDFVAMAWKFAAAYYIATYNPEIRREASNRPNRSILFSFPWIVADVIAAGLRSN